MHFYGIREKNLEWFSSYLSNRKQFIEYDNRNKKTDLLDITCGVPQGSILGPLLFIIFINDLHLVSNKLNFIMFADDTNLFCSDRNIKNLFQKANVELNKISEWFRANKLSLNADKTKYTLFHKPWDKDNLPLKLPVLSINDYEIQRSSSIKFLGVMVDEHLSWNDHISILENKLSKSLGLLYKAKKYLNTKAMTSLYYSFFHSYLTYGNVAWCSTSVSKLKKLASKQRQAVKAIPITASNTGSKSK